MTFSRPEYLWLLTLVASAALGCLLAGRRRRHVRGLYPGHTPWRGLARTTFFLGGLFLVALSAAGPQWGQPPAVPTTGPARLVIVLDCSKSMLARDMAPDRLTAAKALVRAVLARLPKLRVGLVTFAGQTRLACPVTATGPDCWLFWTLLPRSGCLSARTWPAPWKPADWPCSETSPG
jgi:Ca-activated chloride channel family protein